MGLFDKFKKQSKNVNNNEIFNVEKTNVLDAIAYDEKNSKLIMLLSDGMDWHDEPRHLLLLRDKINHYIAYIESKQYLESYSNIEQIEIQIRFLFKETDNCKKFLREVTKIISTSLQNTIVTIENGTKDTFPKG